MTLNKTHYVLKTVHVTRCHEVHTEVNVKGALNLNRNEWSVGGKTSPNDFIASRIKIFVV